ncbi:MAG: L-serine ammonia-lyase [Alphaproteobacteria bacterium]|nr:L-serine ammonia-lyase [Alphaproteobacteria bacterium]MDD9841928.1 L-serine ammonia-lyase [Alphaproteobacteria bacterium]
MLSVIDIFSIGIGPSSSHTVGPLRIARKFANILKNNDNLSQSVQVQITLLGSLALTGKGHGTPQAVQYGLMGLKEDRIDRQKAEKAVAKIKKDKKLRLLGCHEINFDPTADIILDYEGDSSIHPNKMILKAFDKHKKCLAEETYYSTGGGFIASEKQLLQPETDNLLAPQPPIPYPFDSAQTLLELCKQTKRPIYDIVYANETTLRPRHVIDEKLDMIISVMMDSITRGLNADGFLPGGLNVRRRAPDILKKRLNTPPSNQAEVLFDWLNLYAMAVNEENAVGGQIVTAPTNGAAGIIPAIIAKYIYNENQTQSYPLHKPQNPNFGRQFLLTAGAIGLLYKQRASISGAEMGCQGEVGVACSMAAGALAAHWEATPPQIAVAAEIGMEHNLGLTCDPVGGLVQIPCIERNAVAAVKAVNAARLAINTDPENAKVSLDQVIETMRQTGLDMSEKYKETSQGGLAVNFTAC